MLQPAWSHYKSSCPKSKGIQIILLFSRLIKGFVGRKYSKKSSERNLVITSWALSRQSQSSALFPLIIYKGLCNMAICALLYKEREEERKKYQIESKFANNVNKN